MSGKLKTLDFGAPDEYGAHVFRVEIPTARREPKLDRLLGKELCVLAWAAERATVEECPILCGKWGALRPEERWWLFAMTATEAGLADDSERGWRKALYFALADGKVGEKPPKRRRLILDEEWPTLPLFEESTG